MVEHANSPIFRIRFRPLSRRDAVSWVEMDYRQKEWSKEVSKEQYLSYVALEVVLLPYMYVLSLPRLDPRTGVRSTSAGCYYTAEVSAAIDVQHLWCRTRRISYWLLAKTSLDTRRPHGVLT